MLDVLQLKLLCLRNIRVQTSLCGLATVLSSGYDNVDTHTLLMFSVSSPKPRSRVCSLIDTREHKMIDGSQRTQQLNEAVLFAHIADFTVEL